MKIIVRTGKQSVAWRLLAVFAVLVLAATRNVAPLSLAGSWIAAFGMVGFAFGYRIGPILFWRIFAVLASLFMMKWAGELAVQTIAVANGSWTNTAAHITTVGLFCLVSIALLRHARLLPNRSRSDPSQLAGVFE